MAGDSKVLATAYQADSDTGRRASPPGAGGGRRDRSRTRCFFPGFKIPVEPTTPSFSPSITGSTSTEGTCSGDKKEEEAKPEQAEGGDRPV